MPLTIADQLVDAIRRQPLAQRADDGHAAADRRFVIEIDAALGGGREQLVAVNGEQRLVGGDDVLAGGDRGQQVLARGLVAADELEHDLDLGIGEHGFDVGGDQRRRHVDETRLVRFADDDLLDLDGGAAEALANGVGVIGEQLHDAGADITEAEQADGNLAHQGWKLAQR